LFGYETWSLTLREEHRLKVIENRVLRRISGPKRNELTGSWPKLQNELHNLSSSPSIIRMNKSRRIRLTGYVARMVRNCMHIRYWWEGRKETDHYEDQDVGGSITTLQLFLFPTNRRAESWRVVFVLRAGGSNGSECMARNGNIKYITRFNCCVSLM
jgi:hypothetical protein